ncbi:MAG TPA: DUF2510 domain-containing protein [Homoserinimonas sp.]|nr:DUF2510 domain-containing protein [Homoserinimonas sp.]
MTVPAGWYPDPMGLPQLRWWDNYAWTEFTSAARTPLVMQDEPKLAYADDDLPSRRAQREQRQQDGNRQQAGNSADLATTLRQLEPPKPQNIERSQPAPTFTETPVGPTAEEQRQEQQRQEQQFREKQEQQYREQQQQQYRAPEPALDPFAEFLAEPAAPRDNSRSQGGYPEQSPFGAPGAFTEPVFGQHHYSDQGASAGYGQQAESQFAPHAARFGNEQNSSGQYGFAQSRIGVHAPLAYTPFVWIIAMIPLIQLVGILLVVSAVDVAMALPFLVGIAVGPYIAGIPLAIADQRQLTRMGHQRPAHWAWSILTSPAYLVARAIAASREHGKGLTPLLVWASLSLLQVASIIAVPGILISAMPAVFSAEVEESIEADSAIAGRELAVDCPATPPVQIGGTFNCTGVLASTGEEVGIVVRLQRANGWIDWRVYGMVWENATPVAATPDGTDAAPTDVVEGETVEG